MLSRTFCTFALLLCLAFGGLQTAFAQYRYFNAADTHELQSFRLNDDLVAKCQKAAMALTPVAKSHLGETKGKAGQPVTIDDMVAKINSMPDAVAVLHSNGVTPRQYVETTIIAIAGYAQVQLQQAGHPIMHPSPILSAENADYIKQHLHEIGKLFPKTSTSDSDSDSDSDN